MRFPVTIVGGLPIHLGQGHTHVIGRIAGLALALTAGRGLHPCITIDHLLVIALRPTIDP